MHRTSTLVVACLTGPWRQLHTSPWQLRFGLVGIIRRYGVAADDGAQELELSSKVCEGFWQPRRNLVDYIHMQRYALVPLLACGCGAAQRLSIGWLGFQPRAESRDRAGSIGFCKHGTFALICGLDPAFSAWKKLRIFIFIPFIVCPKGSNNAVSTLTLVRSLRGCWARVMTPF